VKKNKWWSILLKYGIGIALLAFVIYRNWHGIVDVLQKPMRPLPYAMAAVCCVTTVFITFFRWYLLVRAQGLPFSLRNAVRLGLVGYFFNTFLPGAVGGDLIKAAAIAREQQRRTVAVSTVLLDRAIGLWALIALVAIVGGVFWLIDPEMMRAQPDLAVIVRSALGVFAGTLAVWFSLGFLPERRAHRFAGRLESIPKNGHVLREFWLAIWLYRNRGGTVLLALLLSMVGHTSSVLMFYFAALTFQPAGAAAAIPGLREHFLLVPIGMAVQAFFPAPGGIGGGEFVFGRLYVLLGFSETAGFFGSMGQRLLTWAIGAVGFVVYSFMKKELPTVDGQKSLASEAHEHMLQNEAKKENSPVLQTGVRAH